MDEPEADICLAAEGSKLVGPGCATVSCRSCAQGASAGFRACAVGLILVSESVGNSVHLYTYFVGEGAAPKPPRPRPRPLPDGLKPF